MSLHLLSSDTRLCTWRMNKNILDNVVALKQISDSISLYFTEILTDNVGLAYIWEGHKAMVRGEFISQGSRLKKAREGELQTLLAKIQIAKLKHKRHMTSKLAAGLQSLD